MRRKRRWRRESSVAILFLLFEQKNKYYLEIDGRLLGGFWRFLGTRSSLFLITGQILNHDHQIDQKKLDPSNPAKVDTYLILPRV